MYLIKIGHMDGQTPLLCSQDKNKLEKLMPSIVSTIKILNEPNNIYNLSWTEKASFIRQRCSFLTEEEIQSFINSNPNYARIIQCRELL